MDPAWRSKLVDSYGTTMKLTWWMMAGNIFRYATNRNMPIPNIMTMYFMKKYHGENIDQLGDELSLHYHTFFWSDYDNDGLFYWNQSRTFMECLDDFEFTLAQLLLEEGVFPVSFRSGWHYMDNDWQQYLNMILPFSMHNDWPAKRTDQTEPLDNTFDWSLASNKFVPWHPSTENYQLVGNGSGWNVRSKHFNSARYYDLMDTVFSEASQGIDQVVCLWGHLPETDFISNLEILDSLAHDMEEKYQGVKFRYCTAIEAMQRWMGTSDSISPQLTFNHYTSGGKIYFRISADEPLFQSVPSVMIKDIYENYELIWCQPTGMNQWETIDGIDENFIAKAGIALTDTCGNQSIEIIEFLPDDIYLDNQDIGFQELYGNWSSITGEYWNLEYIRADMNTHDSAAVRWDLGDVQPGRFNIFYQAQPTQNPAKNIEFKIFQNNLCTDTVKISQPYQENEWLYIATTEIDDSGNDYVEMKSTNSDISFSALSADVLKLSALVRDRELYIQDGQLNFGVISEADTTAKELKLQNRGINPITIAEIYSKNNFVTTDQLFPFEINPMSSKFVKLKFFASDVGLYSDTLIIESDDPVHPHKEIPVQADVTLFFAIIDNEDTHNYVENGDWYYSVAQAYGPSSRYSYLNQGSSAEFSRNIIKSGRYAILQIVPQTINSADRAQYIISIDGNPINTFYVDQNQNSGQWVHLGEHFVPGYSLLKIRIYDSGESTAGVVLRADAIKIALVEEITNLSHTGSNIPDKFSLSQNYPNPFNNTTVIEYEIPKASSVKLVIYNTLGQLVKSLVNNEQLPGGYRVTWFGKDIYNKEVASGIYYYHLSADNYSDTKKLIVLK
jgi:hypothetical protein